MFMVFIQPLNNYSKSGKYFVLLSIGVDTAYNLELNRDELIALFFEAQVAINNFLIILILSVV